MAKKPFLSVIVHARDEERKLPLALIAVDYYLADKKIGYEIIVSTHNSTDKTRGIIKRFQPLIKNLRWLDVNNIGQGILTAKGKWCWVVDVNSARNLSKFENYVSHLESGHDILIGSQLNALSLAREKQYKIKGVPAISYRGIIDYLAILCQTFRIQYYLKQCLKNTT